MRFFLLLFIFSTMTISAGPLDEHLWKSRIVVLDFSSEDVQSLRDLEDEIRKTKAEWKDREITFFHVGELNRAGAGYASQLTESQRVAVRKRLGLNGSKGSSITLLGKDGGVKKTPAQGLQPPEVL